jgi:glycosyltransferase involved in cell wall biosynthesis
MEIHRVGSRMTFGLHVPRYLKRRLDPNRFHVVVEDLNKVPMFMPFWTHRPVVLLVHHLFGTTAFREASFPVAAATWILERSVPRVFKDIPAVAVSESTAADLRTRGLSGQGIAVVPNGVDLEALTPGAPEDRFPTPTVLYLGRLKRYKGIDLILRATARLRKTGTTLRLLIAGKGDDLPRLRRLGEKLELGDTVDFLGYVPEEEKVRLLRRSWTHILTSPKEGWGISILEASACGTPTIASDSPGLRDAVVDGRTGVLVPHGDVTALSEAISRLLQDLNARERMGAAARSFAEGFTWERSASTMEAFLQARVAGTHPPS